MGPCKSKAAVMIRFLGALLDGTSSPPPPPRPAAAAAAPPDQKLRLCVQTGGKETPARLPRPPPPSLYEFPIGLKKKMALANKPLIISYRVPVLYYTQKGPLCMGGS